MIVKPRICVPIVNRTNYSKLKPVMMELRKYHEDIELYVVASSAMLLEKYGHVSNEILADGFAIDKSIDCLLMNDTHEAMVKAISLSMIEHSSYFSTKRPDLILAVGDRFDMLAPVMAGAMMNIPIAHIQGGEESGTIDNQVRDLISRVASLHFVATEKSKERLVKTGIQEKKIFNFGCPAIEYIANLNVGTAFDYSRFHKKKFKRDICINPDEKYFLVMVHPDTTVDHDVDMEIILDVVNEFGVKVFVFYPNVDAHNFRIVSPIAKYSKNEQFFLIRHMPLEDFVHTLAHSSLMIGNSSSGIREAASFGVPVINIGTRQQGRERNKNTIDVPADAQQIREAIQRFKDYKFPIDNIYYKAGCSDKIAKSVLAFLAK